MGRTAPPRRERPAHFTGRAGPGADDLKPNEATITNGTIIKAVKPLEPAPPDSAGYNLLGQRLGRKGQETRSRILAAALRLIENPQDVPLTLSGVAREVSVGMTTLYLYFPDLGELVLACLMQVMDSADDAFVDRLRTRWPDETLAACTLDFLRAHHQFWRRHTRILHMRNSFADAGDDRFLDYRNRISLPLIDMLIRQMGGEYGETDTPAAYHAVVLLTGFERIATVVTNLSFKASAAEIGQVEKTAYVDNLLSAEAEIIALTIARQRGALRR